MSDLNAQIKISVLDAFSPGLKRLGLELRDVTGELGKTEKESSKLKAGIAQVTTALNQASQAMGQIRSFGMVLLDEPIRQFASLDQALSKVSAKTGELRGSKGFETLKQQALDLGAATKYSAEQVAEAQAEFAASGRNTAEVLTALPTTLSFATAGSIELGRAAAITNEVLNQFNLTAQDTAKAQDILARADEISAASISDLGDAFQYVGGTAARLKIPLETTTALLSMLADAGQKGSVGGTNLSNFLSRLVAPTKMAKDALSAMGLSLKEVATLQQQVATGDVQSALSTLAGKNAKLTPEKSAELLDKVFGEQGGRAASVLFRGSLNGTLGSRDSEMKKSEGAVTRTAKIMETSFAASLERAKGAIDGLIVRVGEAWAPRLEKFATFVEKAADQLGDYVEKNPEVIETVGKVILAGTAFAAAGAAITGVMASIGGLVLAIEPFAPAIAIVIGALTGPIGLAVALAAVVAGFYVFRHELYEGVRGLFGKLGIELPNYLTKAQEAAIKAGGSEGGDGTILDARGNLVGDLGGGDPTKAPLLVQEARALGLTDRDDIAEYLRKRARIMHRPPALPEDTRTQTSAYNRPLYAYDTQAKPQSGNDWASVWDDQQEANRKQLAVATEQVKLLAELKEAFKQRGPSTRTSAPLLPR